MSIRHGMAFTAAPLILRVVLGITFVWVGLSKLRAMENVGPDDAARLANVGALEPAAAPDPANGQGMPLVAPVDLNDGQGVRLLKTAADFPQGADVRRMHTEITLRLLKGTEPRVESDGREGRAIWPAWAGGSHAVLLAWVATVTAIAGGVCCSLGLLTRLWAGALTLQMATALWVTTLGPAWSGGRTVLGVLPDHAPWDFSFWMYPAWLSSLLGMSAALALLGPGPLSLDRPLLGAPSSSRTPPRPTA